jgi:hypothetical protein
MSVMAILIEWPALALVPAGLLFALALAARRRLVYGAACGWLAYAVYEYGMKWRWLCSGECNIRVDLLLLYPALLVLTGVALVSGIRALRRRRPAGPSPQ